MGGRSTPDRASGATPTVSATPPLARHAVPVLLALVTLLAPPSPAGAQEVRTALSPDSATVGDVVEVAVRVHLPPGYRVAAPDSLTLPETLENAGRRRVLDEERPDSSLQVTFVYPVTPWHPGRQALPIVPVRVVGPGGFDRTLQAALPPLTVLSVLPRDTTGIKPRPARGVLGANRLLWPYILAALLLLLLLALLAWWLWRRHRRRTAAVPVIPLRTAREQALEALDRVREAGLIAAGAHKEHYSRIAAAVRTYLATLDPAWGTERTTSELLLGMRAGMDADAVRELRRLLGSADLVKFARHRPDAAEGEEAWRAARAWVLAYPPAAKPPEQVTAEAA